MAITKSKKESFMSQIFSKSKKDAASKKEENIEVI
jgi:hypothetical protein